MAVDNKQILGIVVVTIIVVFLLVSIIVGIPSSSSASNNDVSKKESPEINKKTMFNAQDDEPKKFYIYNYLLKSLEVQLLPKTDNVGTGPSIVLAKIPPRQKKGIPMSTAIKFLRTKNMLRFNLFDELKPGLEKLHFADYHITTPKDEMIKALHVGMIASKKVGANQDDHLVTGWNAVQGRPWVKVHNMTNLRINLVQGSINPGGILRYSGRDHLGVRLGTMFEDRDGNYPTFKYKIPATDIYYGIVSDIEQPLFGGWQIDWVYDDDPDSPMYLLELGWLSGPANNNIDPRYIPRNGPEVPLKDRWGNPIFPPFLEDI